MALSSGIAWPSWPAEPGRRARKGRSEVEDTAQEVFPVAAPVRQLLNVETQPQLIYNKENSLDSLALSSEIARPSRPASLADLPRKAEPKSSTRRKSSSRWPPRFCNY